MFVDVCRVYMTPWLHHDISWPSRTQPPDTPRPFLSSRQSLDFAPLLRDMMNAFIFSKSSAPISCWDFSETCWETTKQSEDFFTWFHRIQPTKMVTKPIGECTMKKGWIAVAGCWKTKILPHWCSGCWHQNCKKSCQGISPNRFWICGWSQKSSDGQCLHGPDWKSPH